MTEECKHRWSADEAPDDVTCMLCGEKYWILRGACDELPDADYYGGGGGE